MKLILKPLCLLRYVPALDSAVDPATGVTWATGAHTWHGLPFVEVCEKYRDDQGIHHHEFTHVAQCWLIFGIVVLFGGVMAAFLAGDWVFALPVLLLALVTHGALYSLWRQYRLSCEVAAFRVQMAWPDRSGDFMSLDDAAARLISPRYGFGLTEQAAQAALHGFYDSSSAE